MPFKVLSQEQGSQVLREMSLPQGGSTGVYAPRPDTSADSPFSGGTLISGPKRIKYSESATKSGKFALRMRKELDVMQELERSGFSPINFRDQLVVNVPFLRQPGMFNNMAKSGKYQMYENALINFVMAGLRDESGSAIPTPEVLQAMPLYMPLLGDSAEAIKGKQERRINALSGMISASQGAYGESMGNLEKSQFADDASTAMKIRSDLERRAKTDPKLRALIEERKQEILRNARQQGQ